MYLNYGFALILFFGISWRSSRATDGALDLILDAGYPLEKHRAETTDGYLLTMQRIPNPGRPIVFLMHGLLSSSSDFLLTGPEKSLAFILYDKGYDVWMGNARGNRYSRKHKILDPDMDYNYWDFSWHEIGVYDLPAMIDQVLNVTGDVSLQYIGHSQGTTAFFVMTSERPEYNRKIKSMHALAPVVYMEHAKSPLLAAYAITTPILQVATKQLNKLEHLGYDSLSTIAIRTACHRSLVLRSLICGNIMALLGGSDDKQLNQTLVPAIIDQTPAGGSYKQVFHYAQVMHSGLFRHYDYGSKENMRRYETPAPPLYDLDKITAPIYLYHGDNDLLADNKDVEKLIGKLKTIVRVYKVPLPEFTHTDFLWAIDVIPLLYKRLLEDLQKYT